MSVCFQEESKDHMKVETTLAPQAVQEEGRDGWESRGTGGVS